MFRLAWRFSKLLRIKEWHRLLLLFVYWLICSNHIDHGAQRLQKSQSNKKPTILWKRKFSQFESSSDTTLATEHQQDIAKLEAKQKKSVRVFQQGFPEAFCEPSIKYSEHLWPLDGKFSMIGNWQIQQNSTKWQRQSWKKRALSSSTFSCQKFVNSDAFSS